MIIFIVAEPAGSVGEFKSICSATGTRPGDLESPGSCCELAPRSL
jgi:hypothetical protein